MSILAHCNIISSVEVFICYVLHHLLTSCSLQGMVVGFSLGMGPIPWLIMSEVIPYILQHRF